jgi:hypothetical protein
VALSPASPGLLMTSLLSALGVGVLKWPSSVPGQSLLGHSVPEDGRLHRHRQQPGTRAAPAEGPGQLRDQVQCESGMQAEGGSGHSVTWQLRGHRTQAVNHQSRSSCAPKGHHRQGTGTPWCPPLPWAQALPSAAPLSQTMN